MKRLSIYLLAVAASLFLFTRCGSTSSKKKYQVTINAVPSEGGTVSPSNSKYKGGRKIIIKETPNEGWEFERWSGDYEDTASTAIITVTKDMDIKAHFSKKVYNLTVTTEGQGSVVKKVIPTSSTKGYKAGTVVKLTAKPDSEWKFVKWTGDLSGSENPSRVTVNGPTKVTAVFQQNDKYKLNINTEGKGSVSKDPDQETYKSGTTVTLTAKPDDDWNFVKWTGDLSGSENPTKITIKKNQKVTAVFNVFSGGDGSKSNPYQVSTLKQLEKIQDYSSSYFVQTKDINASNMKNRNNGKGFKPIGTNTNPFNGTYNGQGHTIKGIFVNRPQSKRIGLFGQIGENGIVENIHLTEVDITGGKITGGLVGMNYGKIKNVEVSSMQGQVHATAHDVGGLVGSNQGTIKSSQASIDVIGDGHGVGGLVGWTVKETKIIDSHADGKVTGEGERVGGLIGSCGGCVIINSYATGNVQGKDNYTGGLIGAMTKSGPKVKSSYATGNVVGVNSVGGLVGSAHGLISDSYATGNVHASRNNVGGLVGITRKGSKVESSYATGNVQADGSRIGGLVGNDKASVVNSYAKGDVSGAAVVGGLIGTITQGSIKNSYSIGKSTATGDVGGLAARKKKRVTISQSYWDTETSGLSDSAGGTGLKTNQMQGAAAKNNMGGFDFTKIWKTVSGDYPVLQWQQ